MKLYKTFGWLTALSMAAAGVSCSSDMNGEPDCLPSASEEGVLTLDISMPTTRAEGEKTEFTEGDKIFVVAAYSEEIYQTTSAVYTDGKWALEDKVDLVNFFGVSSPENITVGAVYPYSEVKDCVWEGSYLSGLNDLLEQKDLLYGMTSGVNKKNAEAKILFTHAKASVKFRMSNPTEAPVYVTSISLINNPDSFEREYGGWLTSSAGIGLNGMYHNEDCSIENRMDLAAETVIQPGEAGEIGLLIPQTLQQMERLNKSELKAGGLLLEIEANKKTFRIKISEPFWAPGTQYIYPIELPWSVTDERTANRIDMGVMGDDGMPLYWSDINLGAEYIEDYGTLYCWGDPSGEMRSSSWTDYPMTENISGTEYDAATSLWGKEWRTPTASEIERLIANSTYVWDKKMKGWWITSKTTGNQMFLPSAPYRDEDKVFWSSFRARYWTSDRRTCMEGTDVSIRIKADMEFNYGFPIRPVTQRAD